MKHTPTPCILDGAAMNWFIANAHFVIHATKHHDELVTALTEAVEALAAMRAMYEGWPKDDIPRWRELIERASVWQLN